MFRMAKNLEKLSSHILCMWKLKIISLTYGNIIFDTSQSSSDRVIEFQSQHLYELSKYFACRRCYFSDIFSEKKLTLESLLWVFKIEYKDNHKICYSFTFFIPSSGILLRSLRGSPPRLWTNWKIKHRQGRQRTKISPLLLMECKLKDVPLVWLIRYTH